MKNDAAGDAAENIDFGNWGAEFLDDLGGVAKPTDRFGRDTTYLYQKVNRYGNHLKFGISKNPSTRYTEDQLGGGKLRIIGRGNRPDMLQLERQLHETLPIGPEERQLFYIQKQLNKGLRPPPY